MMAPAVLGNHEEDDEGISTAGLGANHEDALGREHYNLSISGSTFPRCCCCCCCHLRKEDKQHQHQRQHGLLRRRLAAFWEKFGGGGGDGGSNSNTSNIRNIHKRQPHRNTTRVTVTAEVLDAIAQALDIRGAGRVPFGAEALRARLGAARASSCSFSCSCSCSCSLWRRWGVARYLVVVARHANAITRRRIHHREELVALLAPVVADLRGRLGRVRLFCAGLEEEVVAAEAKKRRRRGEGRRASWPFFFSPTSSTPTSTPVSTSSSAFPGGSSCSWVVVDLSPLRATVFQLMGYWPRDVARDSPVYAWDLPTDLAFLLYYPEGGIWVEELVGNLREVVLEPGWACLRRLEGILGGLEGGGDGGGEGRE